MAAPETLALPQRELGRLLAAGQWRACSLEEDARVIVEGRFVLKGAMLYVAWKLDDRRTTMDLVLLRMR